MVLGECRAFWFLSSSCAGVHAYIPCQRVSVSLFFDVDYRVSTCTLTLTVNLVLALTLALVFPLT